MPDITITPRRAVESIAHSAGQLAAFVGGCRDSFAVSRDLLKWANNTRAAQGDSFDPGQFWPAVALADRMFVTLLFDDIDQSSYLFGLGTVRLWTALEAGVNDLVIALMQRDDSWKTLQAFRKIKVPAGDFVAMSSYDQMKHLLVLYQANAGGRQMGVGRFDDILTAVGLGGNVDDYVRKVIVELVETRHVLVHRGGIPDAQFEARCAWVPKYGGGILRVTPAGFLKFLFGVMSYMAELMARLQSNGWLDGSQSDNWRSICANGVRNLRNVVDHPPTPPPGSIQEWWNELLVWKDGVAPPNPFSADHESRPDDSQVPGNSQDEPDVFRARTNGQDSAVAICYVTVSDCSASLTPPPSTTSGSPSAYVCLHPRSIYPRQRAGRLTLLWHLRA